MQYQQVLGVLIDTRRRCGLSQADVARRLGKSQHFVSQYEEGARRLDVIEFVDVAEALGLNPINELRRVFFPTNDLEEDWSQRRNSVRSC